MPRKKREVVLDRSEFLVTIEAFLPKHPDVINIIKICHLFPVKSWRGWTDHHGNYLKVSNKKKIVSVTNDPTKEEVIITDIYFKAPPKTISDISKWAFISFGRGNEDELDICFLWFLGYDERLRLLSYSKDKWNRNQPPLICGLDTLRPIVRCLDVEDYMRADILRVNGPDAARVTASWATKWPPSEKFKEKISSFEIGKKILDNL